MGEPGPVKMGGTIPHGSAVTLDVARPLEKTASNSKADNLKFVLRVIMGFFQFNTDFDLTLAIFVTITDPDLVQFLPVTAALVNREPRSCHKVHTLESQAGPNVVQSDTFNGATGDQRLQRFGFHFKNVSPVKRNSSGR